MKKTWLPCLGVLAFCLLLTPGPTYGNIGGSAHDFSVNGWSDGEVCRACHTPHDADTGAVGAPLWDHEVSTATHTLYASPTMKGVPEQPQGVTRLCLSCHDGTVALDSFGGVSGGDYLAGDAMLGIGLGDDHPVSIRWEHQNDMSNGTCGKCHDVHGTPSFVSELPFFDGYVECASCHDVHNGPGYETLLRMPLAGSELCLHCHGK